MKDLRSIESAARARIRAFAPEIEHSLRSIETGHPGDAEPDETRKTAVVQARRKLALPVARQLARSVGPEAVWGQTVDFIDVAFFARGVLASRSVCRVAVGGRGIGTGFLISPRLFITNNHVIESASMAREMVLEFDYELDIDGNPRTPSRFALAPQDLFVTNDQDELDYTVVAVGSRVNGPRELATFGSLPLSGARNKHALGDFVNIIQHPEARMKQAVVRDNQLVSRPSGGTVLHYVADTEPGSSGSPVFNLLWDVVALHHWGGPHRELFDERGVRVPQTVNEGIRISAIVSDLQTRSASLASTARSWISDALKRGVDSSGHPSSTAVVPSYQTADTSGPASDSVSMTLSADGTATWRIPLTVSVRLGSQPMAANDVAPSLGVTGNTDLTDVTPLAEAKFPPDENYASREGYDPTFLRKVFVPLPKLSAKQRKLAAKGKPRAKDAAPYELKYEHFSVVMNGKRRLAFFTATNIDGAKSKDVNRQTGVITEPERIAIDDDASEGAEASEAWFQDPRIAPTEQTPSDFYAHQTAFDASGSPIQNKRTQDHLNRIFQQGHLTRRQDPTWGEEDEVLRANADTFHVTNRAPQVGFFNMGSRKPASEAKAYHPGGVLHWRALEDWVLENARADRERVSVFCGPIFDEAEDIAWDRGIPEMKGFKAPRQYWKLVAHIEAGELRATALLADQSALIDFVPEALPTGGEELERVAFEKVEKYQVSIAELARLSGLAFSAVLVAADTFVPSAKNTKRRKVETLQEVALEPLAGRRKPKRKGSRTRAAAKRKRAS